MIFKMSFHVLSTHHDLSDKPGVFAVLFVVTFSFIITIFRVLTSVLRHGTPSQRVAGYFSCLKRCSREEGTKEAYRDVARLIKSHIKDGDLTTTDAAASLVLIKKRQDRSKGTRKQVAKDSTALEDLKFQQLLEFFPYAKASYGYSHMLLTVS